MTWAKKTPAKTFFCIKQQPSFIKLIIQNSKFKIQNSKLLLSRLQTYSWLIIQNSKLLLSRSLGGDVSSRRNHQRTQFSNHNQHSLTTATWDTSPPILHSSLFTLHFHMCKVTHNFFPFPKNAKKLHRFNIRLYGILTFHYPSMRHIAMVDE